MNQKPQTTKPYTALAEGYDAVMDYIDYDYWAEHAHDLLREHHPNAFFVLELGCGTGSLAVRLQPRGGYRYRATDRSPAMIRLARAKAERHEVPARFAVADFTDYDAREPADAALLLYDGLNYVLREDPLRALFRCTRRALRPGGVFIVDHTTPINSTNNAEDFEDEGRAEDFRYKRRSRYDEATRLHTTTFEVQVNGQTYREEHVQRTYDPVTIRRLAEESGFEAVAAYDGFTTAPDAPDSERVHHVLRRPARQ